MESRGAGRGILRVSDGEPGVAVPRIRIGEERRIVSVDVNDGETKANGMLPQSAYHH